MFSLELDRVVQMVMIDPRTDGGLGQLRTDGGGRMTAPLGDLEN